MARHIRYLRREGVTRDGDAAEMFGKAGPADHEAFAARCEPDRHHFRFIVSPEDAERLQDLRAVTRDLMAQAARDLGTRLDWVAVDHWNTDNPHVHVLIRGVADDGKDLIIDREYITQGLRKVAERLVELELGLRTQKEIETGLDREVTSDRWTSLDRQLRNLRGPDGRVNLRPGDADVPARLIGRANHLQRLGLAEPRAGVWTLADDLEQRLRALAVRCDIIKTMHAAMRGEARDPAQFVLHPTAPDPPVVGRLVERGLHDELNGQAYVVVDGLDGRLHHVRFSDLDRTGDTRLNGIVEVRAWTREGQSSRADLVHRSDLSIERQITARGATWLDRRLVSDEPSPGAGAFAREVRDALTARRMELTRRGLADDQGRPVGGLLEKLRSDELRRVRHVLAAETGLEPRSSVPGESVAGVYRRRVDLASGRFAMIDDGLGFQLVPWSRTLEPRRDEQVRGVISKGGGIDWVFDRKRGISL
jgi:type IV secretory pathway VirD2 relaxase